MLQGQALIANMGQRAQRLADEWTPEAGPFVQFITFALCHVYLEGANDALKDEITRQQQIAAESAASLAGRTRRAGKTAEADRAGGKAIR